MHPTRTLTALFALLALALPALSMDADVVPITLRELDMELFARSPTACGNQGQIGRNKYNPHCLPANSKGYRSSHNCETKAGGKSYLCVLSGVATCYTSNLKKLNMEGGECFL